LIEQNRLIFIDGEGRLNTQLIKDVIEMDSDDKEENLITLKLIIAFYKTAKQTIGDNRDAKK